MANPKPVITGKGGVEESKQAHHLGVQLRSSFIASLYTMRRKYGLELHELLADQLYDKPLDTLRTMAQFFPRNISVEQTVSFQSEFLEVMRGAQEIARQRVIDGAACDSEAVAAVIVAECDETDDDVPRETLPEPEPEPPTTPGRHRLRR